VNESQQPPREAVELFCRLHQTTHWICPEFEVFLKEWKSIHSEPPPRSVSWIDRTQPKEADD
jgi:hypothetical protein